ncbi:MAG: nucleoid occlusion protein [Syntrophomonadaceae bacterium]|nr:nucleoid occlusion protein [Syntrophomonadaceae bacterium]
MDKKPWGKLLARVNSQKVLYIPLEEIRRNPFQPRWEFDETEIEELAKSIEMYGVLQPIIVRKAREGYQLIAGERRLRACRRIGAAAIPALIQEMSDKQSAEVSLIENLQRKDLSYLEEAGAYAQLINEFGLTQEELAQKIGKSQSAIANKLRVLKLPRELRCLIVPETITERHARALLKLNSVEVQKEVLLAIYEKDLNVKETEEIVENLRQNNIPQGANHSGHGQQVSIIIKDARIFLNTIKETVNRARQIGLDMCMIETERDEEYEIIIRVPKIKRNAQLLAK